MALLWIVHELSCLNSPPRQLIIMRKCPAILRNGTLQLVSLILINWIVISPCSFWTTGTRNDKAKSRLLSASFTGCNYSISTWSSRVFSVRDLTQLKRGSWENTKFLEGIRDSTIARVASLAEVLVCGPEENLYSRFGVRWQKLGKRDQDPAPSLPDPVLIKRQPG